LLAAGGITTIRLVESSPDAIARQLRRSGYSAEGFAARYNANRPRPPRILLDLLPHVAGVERPALVVDIGSGTGLSTRFWAESADSVVGVEANPEMRRYAEMITREENVRYLGAPSQETTLPDACADIVTCAQSLQWMDPRRTFDEIGRILRPAGVFVAYNYRSLLTGSWEVDKSFIEVRDTVGRLREQLGLNRDKRRWPVSRERLEASDQFRFTNETSVHSVETGNAERLIGFLLSEGSVTTLLERVSEEAIGLDRLRTIAAKMLGDGPAPWYIGYRVWFGVK
jgi:SAM-dependent methyltransferase